MATCPSCGVSTWTYLGMCYFPPGGPANLPLPRGEYRCNKCGHFFYGDVIQSESTSIDLTNLSSGCDQALVEIIIGVLRLAIWVMLVVICAIAAGFSGYALAGHLLYIPGHYETTITPGAVVALVLLLMFYAALHRLLFKRVFSIKGSDIGRALGWLTLVAVCGISTTFPTYFIAGNILDIVYLRDGSPASVGLTSGTLVWLIAFLILFLPGLWFFFYRSSSSGANHSIGYWPLLAITLATAGLLYILVAGTYQYRAQGSPTKQMVNERSPERIVLPSTPTRVSSVIYPTSTPTPLPPTVAPAATKAPTPVPPTVAPAATKASTTVAPTARATNTPQVVKCEPPGILSAMQLAIRAATSLKAVSHSRNPFYDTVIQVEEVVAVAGRNLHYVRDSQGTFTGLEHEEAIIIGNLKWQKSDDQSWGLPTLVNPDEVPDTWEELSQIEPRGDARKVDSIVYADQPADVYHLSNAEGLRGTLYLNSKTCLPIGLELNNQDASWSRSYVWNTPVVILPPNR